MSSPTPPGLPDFFRSVASGDASAVREALAANPSWAFEPTFSLNGARLRWGWRPRKGAPNALTR